MYPWQGEGPRGFNVLHMSAGCGLCRHTGGPSGWCIWPSQGLGVSCPTGWAPGPRAAGICLERTPQTVMQGVHRSGGWAALSSREEGAGSRRLIDLTWDPPQRLSSPQAAGSLSPKGQGCPPRHFFQFPTSPTALMPWGREGPSVPSLGHRNRVGPCLAQRLGALGLMCVMGGR